MQAADVLVTKAMHSSVWGSDLAIKAAENDVFPLLKFIPELAQLQISKPEEFSEIFESDFRLGPGGLHPLIFWLKHFQTLISINSDVSSEVFTRLTMTVDYYATALMSLVLYFRTTVNRAEYDPIGFRELRQELCIDTDRFGVSLSQRLRTLVASYSQ